MLLGYVLSKKDLEDVEQLLKVTKAINNRYKKLYELEIANQKDSDEFSNNIMYLTLATEVEDQIYERMNLTSEKCLTVLENVLEYDDSDGYTISDMDMLLSRTEFNRVIKRITTKLLDIYKMDINTMGLLHPEMKMMLDNSDMTEGAKMDSISLGKKVEEEFDYHVLNRFIYFVQTVIDDKTYHFFRDGLMRIKYNVAILNKDIELEMITSKFDICDFSKDNFDLPVTALKIKEKVYNLIKNTYGKLKVEPQMVELLKMSDLDYNDKDNAIAGILKQAYMESWFSLLDEDTISDINYNFHSAIENNNYINEHQDDKISIGIIMEAFNKRRKRDKLLHR